MKKNIKMNRIFILFLLISTTCFAQLELRENPYLKGEIILKSGEIKNGFVKLDGSAFSVKFKEIEQQKKPLKIDTDSIEKIVTNPNTSKSRQFYYKVTNENKFKKFVEFFYSNNFELYIYSVDNLSLFYSGVDRSNAMDVLNYERQQASRMKSLEELSRNDGKDVWMQKTNVSYSKIKENLSKAKNIKYLLCKKDSEILNFIPSNKKLLDFATENFKDCNELIMKIKTKEFVLDDVVEIIDCFSNCNSKKN